MAKGPSSAANSAHKYIDIRRPPVRLRDLLIEIIVGEGWKQGDDAVEVAERWQSKFELYIRQRISRETERSQVPCCEISPTNENFVQGTCFISKADSPEVRKQKLLRANNHLYREAFSRLSDLDFEHLCGRILSLFKVEEAKVSRASADQGIDFFGSVPFGEILKPSSIISGAESQLKIWLVGQAKNYSASQVSTKDIRELVGSVNLAKSKAYAGANDPLSDLQMRACDPVFFLFFTTGRLSRDAWSLLSKSGVVAMDGDQLAVFLADHGVGMSDEEFSEDKFRQWAEI